MATSGGLPGCSTTSNLSCHAVTWWTSSVIRDHHCRRALLTMPPSDTLFPFPASWSPCHGFWPIYSRPSGRQSCCSSVSLSSHIWTSFSSKLLQVDVLHPSEVYRQPQASPPSQCCGCTAPSRGRGWWWTGTTTATPSSPCPSGNLIHLLHSPRC